MLLHELGDPTQVELVPGRAFDLTPRRPPVRAEHDDAAQLPGITLQPLLAEALPPRPERVAPHTRRDQQQARAAHAGGGERAALGVDQQRVLADVLRDELPRVVDRAVPDEREATAVLLQDGFEVPQLRHPLPREQSTEVPQEHHHQRAVAQQSAQRRRAAVTVLQRRVQHRADVHAHI